MKLIFCFSLICLLLAVRAADAQGFVYDQQSTNLIEGAAFLQSGQPMGQSFKPSLLSIGFIVLSLYDSDAGHSSGSTVYVNLRSNAITGIVLISTTPIFLPDHFFGITNFFFTTPVAVVSGITYYMQPVIQAGDTVGSDITDGSYPNGNLIVQGNPISGRNLWFQEGVITTPEPSAIALLVLGGGCLAIFGMRKKRHAG